MSNEQVTDGSAPAFGLLFLHGVGRADELPDRIENDSELLIAIVRLDLAASGRDWGP